MGILSFRGKLIAAMMAVVAGVTFFTLLEAQRRTEATYYRLFEQQSLTLNKLFSSLREARLTGSLQRCATFSRSVRLRAILKRYQSAVEGGDAGDLRETAGILYQTAENELRESLEGSAGGGGKAVFFRFLDSKGQPVHPVADSAAGFVAEGESAELDPQLRSVGEAGAANPAQMVGTLALKGSARQARLVEVVVTRIVDPKSEETLGTLALGFPMPGMPASAGRYQSAVWLRGEVFSETIKGEDARRVGDSAGRACQNGERDTADFTEQLNSISHRVFFQKLGSGRGFPLAGQLVAFSVEEVLREQQQSRIRILAVGSIGLVVALVFSLVLAHGLTGPVRDLMTGAGEIQKGNFGVRVEPKSRDELGRLGMAFNEMAGGLEEREKFRSVLNMVADKTVAEEMMSGRIALGGETREISVLFCDIRGFTALTEKMDPREVIEMLNEHMTALTKVVYAHNGVVDKFVGDLIMAIFGAPKSYGNDAFNAAQCALDMITARSRLNETGGHKIEVGIGVATGHAVAGCMGSVDRLNYTVLGERVNLASRLCSKAGRMEVVVDRDTLSRLGNGKEMEVMEPLELKGYTLPVPAFKLKWAGDPVLLKL